MDSAEENFLPILGFEPMPYLFHYLQATTLPNILDHRLHDKWMYLNFVYQWIESLNERFYSFWQTFGNFSIYRILYTVREGRGRKAPGERRTAEYDGSKYEKQFDLGRTRYSGAYEVADYELGHPPPPEEN